MAPKGQLRVSKAHNPPEFASLPTLGLGYEPQRQKVSLFRCSKSVWLAQLETPVSKIAETVGSCARLTPRDVGTFRVSGPVVAMSCDKGVHTGLSVRHHDGRRPDAPPSLDPHFRPQTLASRRSGYGGVERKSVTTLSQLALMRLFSAIATPIPFGQSSPAPSTSRTDCWHVGPMAR